MKIIKAEKKGRLGGIDHERLCRQTAETDVEKHADGPTASILDLDQLGGRRQRGCKHIQSDSESASKSRNKSDKRVVSTRWMSSNHDYKDDIAGTRSERNSDRRLKSIQTVEDHKFSSANISYQATDRGLLDAMLDVGRKPW